MSNICYNCRHVNMSNWDYCRGCDVALSDYAKNREKKEKCINNNCKALNPIHANFCGVCGYALSEYAKRSKRTDNSKLRQSNESLKYEIESINQKLSESNSRNKDDAEKLNDVINKLANANNIIEALKGKGISKFLPIWLSVLFSILGVAFLVLLIIFRN